MLLHLAEAALTRADETPKTENDNLCQVEACSNAAAVGLTWQRSPYPGIGRLDLAESTFTRQRRDHGRQGLERLLPR